MADIIYHNLDHTGRVIQEGAVYKVEELMDESSDGETWELVHTTTDLDDALDACDALMPPRQLQLLLL